LSLKELLDISEDWRQENKKQFIVEQFKENQLSNFLGCVDEENIDRQKLIQVLSEELGMDLG